MESQSQKMISIIEKMLPLLDFSHSPSAMHYHSFFEYILGQLNHPHELHKIAQNILQIYGGMGTFGDLILQKDRKMLLDENVQFEYLRNELYKACEEAIIETRGEI